jgi:chromosome segregation ATPase
MPRLPRSTTIEQTLPYHIPHPFFIHDLRGIDLNFLAAGLRTKIQTEHLAAELSDAIITTECTISLELPFLHVDTDCTGGRMSAPFDLMANRSIPRGILADISNIHPNVENARLEAEQAKIEADEAQFLADEAQMKANEARIKAEEAQLELEQTLLESEEAQVEANNTETTVVDLAERARTIAETVQIKSNLALAIVNTMKLAKELLDSTRRKIVDLERFVAKREPLQQVDCETLNLAKGKIDAFRKRMHDLETLLATKAKEQMDVLEEQSLDLDELLAIQEALQRREAEKTEQNSDLQLQILDLQALAAEKEASEQEWLGWNGLSYGRRGRVSGRGFR